MRPVRADRRRQEGLDRGSRPIRNRPRREPSTRCIDATLEDEKVVRDATRTDERREERAREYVDRARLRRSRWLRPNVYRTRPSAPSAASEDVPRAEAASQDAAHRCSSARDVRQAVPRQRARLDDQEDHREPETLVITRRHQSHYLRARRKVSVRSRGGVEGRNSGNNNDGANAPWLRGTRRWRRAASL